MKVMNYICLYLYFSCLTVICYREYRVKKPENLKNIYKIYNSWFTIENMRPVMTWDHVFFIKNNVLNAFNYKNIIFSASIYYPYGSGSYLKPIDAFSMTNFNFYSLFFTKDCSLRMYTDESNKETYFDLYNIDLNLKFEELGPYCYDTLRFYYDSNSHYAAVYNLYSKKIIVFNLYDVAPSGRNKKYEEFFKVSMDNNIKKALIFSSGEKILLIGIDARGVVNFWNLKGYCEGFFNSISCAYNDFLIYSYQIKDYQIYSYDQEFATIINDNILLLIVNSKFITFDLMNVKYMSTQMSFISKISCVLELKDGNALVGTDKGYIHLIKYDYSKIKILDKRLLCPNQEIYSLSLNSNCTPETYTCYIITANCGGYIYIFEIRNSDTDL